MYPGSASPFVLVEAQVAKYPTSQSNSLRAPYTTTRLNDERAFEPGHPLRPALRHRRRPNDLKGAARRGSYHKWAEVILSQTALTKQRGHCTTTARLVRPEAARNRMVAPNRGFTGKPCAIQPRAHALLAAKCCITTLLVVSHSHLVVSKQLGDE
jgi:hypothetical protein